MKKQFAVLVVVLLIAVSQATSQPLFGDPTLYSVGYHPRAVFSADLDGDSDKDLAVANLLSMSVTILLNDGDGAFVASGEYDAGGEPVSVFSVDLDGDGDNDLAVANSEPDSVSILLNNGDGTFAPKVEYYAGSHPTSVFSADLDGDLDNDLAVTNYESDSVSILLNNGDGTFTPPVMYGAGDGPHSVFSADFDGINGNDLALANRISSNVSILLNCGDGTFTPSGVYGVAGHTTTVFANYFDTDCYIDLAVTTDGDEVSILLNNGDGTFATSEEYGVGDQPNSVFSVDLDGDLDNDLAISNYESDDVSILLNNGDGTFATSEEYSVDIYPHWVFAADFDGDGDNDLVTAHNNTDNVSILLNTTGPYSCTFAVAFDIKPGSCPNPLNINTPRAELVWETENVSYSGSAKQRPDGPTHRAPVLPAAVLGTADFDVTQIDPSTITLEGLSPTRWSYADVGTPVAEDTEECACNDDGPDGLDDLLLKFDKADIVAALGDITVGETVVFTLTGELYDGTPIEGTDCVVIVGGGHYALDIDDYDTENANKGSIIPTKPFLSQNHPNPFNPTTAISFSLPHASEVELVIYNITGQRVKTLTDGQYEPGVHSVIWDGRDESGVSVASGVYFYRIEAGEFVESKKMMLLK